MNGGMLGESTIHLGKLRGDDQTIYLVDGQQRRVSCSLSGLPEFIGDFSMKTYETMLEMAKAYEKFNEHLAMHKPDDKLKAREMWNDNLRQLRIDCPFIGYSNVRRTEDERSPALSMSVALKSWFGSGLATPGQQAQAIPLVDQLDENQRHRMTVFLITAHTAWGNDRAYGRLWSSLNLILCMYLYRTLVLDPGSRRVPLPIEMFRKCLMSVSANSTYIDWLEGRRISDRDRSPCYKRLKSIFAERLSKEYGGKPVRLPQPTWQT
jgi:hypothetical protein